MSYEIQGLNTGNGKKIAFYQPISSEDLPRVKSKSPGILHFFAWLENLGHEVDYFITEHDLLNGLKTGDFDVVSISGAEPSIENVYTSAFKIKEQNPNLPIILGGYITKGTGKNLIHHPSIDVLVEGEAEYTLPLVLDNLPDKKEENYSISSEEAKNIIDSSFTRVIDGKEVEVMLNNVIVKDETGRLVYNPNSNSFGSNTDVTPLNGELDDKIDLGWFSTYGRYTPGVMQDDSGTGELVSWTETGIYIGRGCAGSCNFCSIEGNVRRPSIDSVIETIENTIGKYSAQTPARRPFTIGFSDDSFFQDKVWSKELLDAIISKELNFEMNFSAQYRVVDAFSKGGLDTGLLDLLSKANFKQYLGVESLDAKTLEYMGKVGSGSGERYVDMAKELILTSLEKNIPTGIYLISTTPNSTIESVTNDYLTISNLAKEAYTQTGRVFDVSGNLRLIPLSSDKRGVENLDFAKDGLVMPYDEVTSMMFEDIGYGGKFFPLKKEGEEHYGVFAPTVYGFNSEVVDFLKIFNGDPDTDRIFMDQISKERNGITYLKNIGEALKEYSLKNSGQLLAEANEIISNIDFIRGDELGNRQRLKEGYDNSHFSSFIFLNQEEKFKNMHNRMNGEQVTFSNELETQVQRIIDVDPVSYDLIVKRGSPDLRHTLFNNLYMLLTQQAYDFESFDERPFKQSIMDNLKDIKHIQALNTEEGRFSGESLLYGSLHSFSKANERVKKVFEHGLAACPEVSVTSDRKTLIDNTSSFFF